jgi:signal transduction histidine kinase/ActR/RegA family two-component response regulator
MLDVLADQPEHQAAVRAVWQRALDGEEFVEVSEFGDLGRDRRFYEMRFSTLRDSEGRLAGAYQFVYDVTNRLLEQERLRQAEEELRQAQKMEAVGQLTGGLAHDFNNLLAGITGAFELIRVRLAQGRTADVERYLQAGQGAARRAAALTHRLLAFSRRQTLSPKPVVINRLMADLAELVQRTVGPGIQVETIAAAGLWPAMVDANQLENALLNLCINARDAMLSGGRLTIETANKWLDDRASSQRGLDPGQYVTVCVSDTGTGIDKAIIDRVFDPFFTTKPMGQGTGLGLSMVYGFARQSDGHVGIYSEPGQGTMVCIYLPRHAGDEDVEAVELDEMPAASESGETILVIDDEPTVRMLVADALGEQGYTIVEAGDGAEGLRLLQSRTRVDLLITDVGLPGGLNGRQVADAAWAARPDLKVLFITGYAENAVLNHGHLAHGMQVLTKPFTIDDLVRRVDRMLRD